MSSELPTTPLPVAIILWCIYAFALILLIAPVCYFLLNRWNSRKADILGDFNDDVAAKYLQIFHHADEGERTRRKSRSDSSSRQLLIAYYDSQFSRWHFLVPVLLTIALGSLLMLLCLFSAMHWIQCRQLDGAVLPIEVALAILGGYMWVAYDQIARATYDDLRPADLYWAAFRLLIAVPIAYAFSKVFTGALAVPLSFLLGAFPTQTIMTIAQRWASKYMQLTDAQTQQQSQLQALPAVDTFVAERLGAEGMTNPYQLARADPVKLAIRTGYPFSFVLICANQALSWMYFRDKSDVARKYGLDGAGECADLRRSLSSDDQIVMHRAGEVVKELAKELGVTEAALLNQLDEICLDPYTEFNELCWLARNADEQSTASTHTASNGGHYKIAAHDLADGAGI